MSVRTAAACLAATLLLALGLASPAAGQPAPGASVTGHSLMSPALRAMQDDDTANPGMLWVEEGRARWATPEGPQRRSCADCHGQDLAASMRGVAARHPGWDDALAAPLTLAGRIATCRERHQRLPAVAARDGAAVLALQAAVAHASRGLPVRPPEDARLAPWRDQGRALWSRRMGQLDLSCAECHDDRIGARLGGSLIPPGHAAGYPTYRLEWQTLGDVGRRIRNCSIGVRAEPWPAQAAEVLALQVWMAWRERGLPMDAPAVRP